jgi:putative ABC transport system permease protein
MRSRAFSQLRMDETLMSKRSFRLSDSRPDAKRDVDDELAFHLDMRTKEFIEQGMSKEEAREKALASFGDVAAIRNDLRPERATRNHERARREWWFGIQMDVRYALRSLRNNPAFALTAIATLALGIGATLSVFTVVNGVLVRPLPYADPSRIAMIWIASPNQDGTTSNLPLTSGFYNDIVHDARSFERVAAFRAWSYTLGAPGVEPEPVSGARVSPSLFDVLGVHPMLGQAFTPEAAVPGGPREAMISHALWQRRFGSDRSIIGKQVSLNRESFTVVGVMPRGFSFPRGAELPAPFGFGLRTDVWAPLVFDSTDLRKYDVMNLSAVGRPLAGVGLASAERELSGLMKRFLQTNAPTVKLDYKLVPLAEQAAGDVKRGLLILLGAVVFLLVIACANVASLLVARATNRRRELAVRAALGAGPARIARQLVTENVVLAVAGGTLGIAISYWGTRVMLALVPGSMPRADDIGVDWRVLAVAAVVALVVGAVFGVASAYSVRWTRLAETLHSGGTRTTGDTGRRVGRQVLVSAEVALSLMLLIGAALLTRSFIRLQQVHPGFNATGVLTLGASMPVAGRFDPARDGPKWATTFAQASERLAAVPGVVAAGAVSSLPLSGVLEGGGLTIPGQVPDQSGQGPHAQYNVVSGNYFRAAGIKVVAGRVFDSSDDAPGAGTLIVNREFARKYYPSEAAALGSALTPQFTFTRGKQHTIVGIVENVKQQSLDEEAAAQVYIPQAQLTYPTLVYMLRVDGDPLSVVSAVKRELRAVDPTITIRDVRTMEDVLEHSLARQRFSMTLIAVFAISALALALVGLYGVITLIVGQRQREIGLRLALGARPADVVRMVLRDSSRLSLAGVAIGLVGAFALTRVLAALLYDVSTRDAATFVGAGLIVLVVSLAAGLVPARLASRVDPTVALRAD